MRNLSRLKFALASFLLLVFAAFIYAGCTYSYASPNKHRSQVISQATAEDYFRGLVFMRGKIAEQIPEIVDQNDLLSKVNQGEIKKESQVGLEEKILADIKANDPMYLDNFRKSMQSGNQFLIAREIQKSQDMVFASIARMMKLELDDVATAKMQVNQFIADNQEKLRSLTSDYYANKIDKEGFKKEVKAIVDRDKSGLSALFAGKISKDGAKLVEESALILDVLIINVAVVINIAGYINIALAANVAIAVNAETAVNIDYKLNITRETEVISGIKNASLFYNNYINSISNILKTA